MAKIVRKGQKGAAANYISRSRAIRKLQLSIADFRRLCILKGIYPREPSSRKKATAGKNGGQTFYAAKDIKFLLHERIVNSFREKKALLKKISKAIGKGQKTVVQQLEDNMSSYTLDHIVKERYPTFIDAIRDLDDCLSHVFLFASLPVTDRLQREVVEDSARLAAEFLNYVVYTKALRKVFLSIKGIYYQIEIKGVTITYLVPHQFSQEIPHDVDFKVLLTFLEFYRTSLRFINFKLYTELNTKYPPKISTTLEKAGAGIFASCLFEPISNSLPSIGATQETDAPSKAQKKKVNKRVKSLAENMDKIISMDAEVKEEPMMETKTEEEEEEEEEKLVPAHSNTTALFEGLYIFLSREVPRHLVEFTIKCGGGIPSWPITSGSGSPCDEADPRIQYEVIDRPLEQIQVYGDRHYVQPQWIVDSFNAGYLLDVSLYGPGKTLPPHLSPFYSASSIKVEKSEEEKSRIELQKMLMSNKTRKSYEKHEKEVQREHDEQAYLASKRE